MTTNEPKVGTTKTTLLSGNLLILLWMLLGTAACWLIAPLYGWIFLAFSAFSVYIIIRRFMCTSCYYCKSCTKGAAKMSLMFLGANRIPGLSKGTILGLMTFAYVVLTVIPLLLLITTDVAALPNLVVLVGLIAVTTAGLAMRLKKGNKLVTS